MHAQILIVPRARSQQGTKKRVANLAILSWLAARNFLCVNGDENFSQIEDRDPVRGNRIYSVLEGG
jgi:hypothetical protein